MRSRMIRRALAGLAGGAVMVGSAWAGAALVPSGSEDPGEPVREREAQRSAPRATADSRDGAEEPSAAAVPDASTLEPGQVLAGASRVSIKPRPEDYGGRWERSPEECATLTPEALQRALTEPAEGSDHLASTGSPWPENPDCIYMGGFGIGPMNPVSSWDEDLGLWVRTIALRDRQGDDLVLVVVDGEGWFWDYNQKCDDCGIKQLTAELAADESLGLDAENIVIAATHAHSAPDFIGGWGFVPDWYMEQVSDAITSGVREAVGRMRPAVLDVGEQMARPFNRERRDTYRSAEEQQLAWLRAVRPSGRTVATVGAYAAHPTTLGTNDGEAHPDWPGMFEAKLEQRFGGVGMHFMTGLGNMSAAGLDRVHDDSHQTGADDLAALIPRRGRRVEDPDIRTARTTWQQPTTNVPLTALGLPGFFDRQFVPQPAVVQTGEDPEKFQCTSAAPVSVEVAASAARIGDEFAVTAAPGEIFSNFSNTVKEQAPGAVVMPLGQANDALGYMPQSFEMSPVGQQGPGFVDTLQGYAVINYEDAYAVDRCFGDKALETSIDMLRTLGG